MHTTLDQVLQQQQAFTTRFLALLQQRVEAAKATFLLEDLPRQKDQASLRFKLLLINTYQATALFPDPEVQEAFSSVGLSHFHQRWFIALKDITQQLETIAADPEVIVLLKGYCLFHIKAHLDAKIVADILRWLNMTAPLNGNPYVPKMKVDLYKIVRRLRDTDSDLPKRPKDVYDVLMTDVIKQLEEGMGDKEEAHTLLLQISGGNTKQHLKHIVDSCGCEKKDNAFYRRFFPLFKLICPNESLLSEDEHKASNHHYGHYKTYQAKRVKDLIGFYERKRTKRN